MGLLLIWLHVGAKPWKLSLWAQRGHGLAALTPGQRLPSHSRGAGKDNSGLQRISKSQHNPLRTGMTGLHPAPRGSGTLGMRR